MRYILFIMVLSISTSSLAVDLYWIGTSSVWDDKDHWSLLHLGPSCNCVPGANDDVIIDNLSQVQVLIDDGDQVKIRSLIITTKNELFIGGTGPGVGSLTIFDGPSTSLSLSGLIVLRDSLKVINAGFFGILIHTTGVFSIKEGGTLYIDGPTTSVGLRNLGNLTVEGDGTNFGKIIAKNLKECGIENLKQLTNKGLIEVCKMEHLQNSTGVRNTDFMINDTYGVIIVDSINTDNLGFGMANSGDFTNLGNVKITNVTTGISMSTDTFQNSGNIMVSNYHSYAYSVLGDGTLINYGTLEAFTNLDNNNVGIRNVGTAINQVSGIMYLHDLGNNFFNIGIDNYKSFINHGFINIENIVGLGMRNFSSDADFSSDGNIFINLITNDYLDIEFNFEILPGGTLNIGLN